MPCLYSVLPFCDTQVYGHMGWEARKRGDWVRKERGAGPWYTITFEHQGLQRKLRELFQQICKCAVAARVKITYWDKRDTRGEWVGELGPEDATVAGCARPFQRDLLRSLWLDTHSEEEHADEEVMWRQVTVQAQHILQGRPRRVEHGDSTAWSSILAWGVSLNVDHESGQIALASMQSHLNHIKIFSL